MGPRREQFAADLIHVWISQYTIIKCCYDLGGTSTLIGVNSDIVAARELFKRSSRGPVHYDRLSVRPKNLAKFVGFGDKTSMYRDHPPLCVKDWRARATTFGVAGIPTGEMGNLALVIGDKVAVVNDDALGLPVGMLDYAHCGTRCNRVVRTYYPVHAEI